MRVVASRKSKTQQLHKPRPAVVASPPEPKPAPAPNVEVAAPIVNVDMATFAGDNAAAMKLIAEAIKSQQHAPAKPTEWVFDIQRDGNNLIKTITARAKGA